MKKALIIILALLPVMVFSQVSYIIKGSGKSYKEGDRIFLSYKQGGLFIEDSTIVKNGSFEFKGKAATVVRGYVSRNDNPKYAAELFDSFYVYIESGNIILNSADTLQNSIISGTPLNNDYASLVQALKPLSNKIKGLKDPEKLSKEELKDTALVNSTKLKMQIALNELIPVEFKFINEHPDSYVSLLTLSRLSKRGILLAQVEESFSTLNPLLKAKTEGKEIAFRIAEGKKIGIGMRSKDFIQKDVNGKAVKLSDFKGKYILVDFWASWCLPCREENPNLIAAYEKYKNRNFTILSVSIDILANKNNWLDAIKQDQLPWTQVSDLKKPNEASKLYGVTVIPANVLIDPSGKIIGKDLRGKDLHVRLDELLIPEVTQ